MRGKVRLIDDGFYLDGTAEVPGGPPLAFTYRPAFAAEVSAYRSVLGSAKPGDAAARVQAKFLADHLLAWDVDGGPAVTAEAVLRLPPGYLAQVENHVAGYAFTPAAEDDEKKSPSPPG